MGLFDDKDDNGGIIGDVLNMEPRVIINHGDQCYNIAQHAEDTLGPVTFTPRELADLDQKMNLGWWAQQRQQSGVEQNQGTLPLRQSIGERVSDPTFNNVAEGEMVAEQVRRGQLRADWARTR